MGLMLQGLPISPEDNKPTTPTPSRTVGFTPRAGDACTKKPRRGSGAQSTCGPPKEGENAAHTKHYHRNGCTALGRLAQ